MSGVINFKVKYMFKSTLANLMSMFFFVVYQRAEDQALQRELSRQRELEAERRRVADMQRRQLEQEQFSMFEEMIRQQDRQRERPNVHGFNTAARPQDEALLIPGIQGPPLPYLESPTPPQSPQHPSANHSAPSAAPPTFDRSLKPGHLSNNSTARSQTSIDTEQPLRVVTVFLFVLQLHWLMVYGRLLFLLSFVANFCDWPITTP